MEVGTHDSIEGFDETVAGLTPFPNEGESQNCGRTESNEVLVGEVLMDDCISPSVQILELRQPRLVPPIVRLH